MILVDTGAYDSTRRDTDPHDREGMLACNRRNVNGHTTPVLSPPSSPELTQLFADDDEDDDDDSLMMYYRQADETTAETSPWTPAPSRGSKTSPLHHHHSRQLDLAAFARELYDNRLSVLQNEEDTGLSLTAQGELEFAKLMASKRAQASAAQHPEHAEEDKIELTATMHYDRQRRETLLPQVDIFEDYHNQPEDDQDVHTDDEEIPQQTQERQRQHSRKESKITTSTGTCSCASRLSRFKELLDLDLEPIQRANREEVDGTRKQKQQQRAKIISKPLGLIGSLRQVTNRTRSQSVSGIRGLVRSFSTTIHRSSTTPSLSQEMTPAAAAVVHHDQAEADDEENDENKESGKGMRMLSQLVGRVRRSSHRGTKRVNMDPPSDTRPDSRKGYLDERSRIVRRTIIYVPPDSENFLKNLDETFRSSSPSQGQPSLSSASSSDTSTPPPHRDNDADDSSSRRRWEGCTEPQQDNKQLEGIELREMSDGSVTWGIVKNDGNRKSFYDPSRRASKYAIDDDDDEEDIEERVLALMGLRSDTLSTFEPSIRNGPISSTSSPPPVPKRSPQRRQQQAARHISTLSSTNGSSTTDIYYAPHATLPSLLQMISEQERLRHSPSVEEQLDEAMRAFSCNDDDDPPM